MNAVFGNEKCISRFFRFINDRHKIYINRFIQNDPWPWTQDPILREYKFTNVFRELDTGTVWCREKIRKPYSDHPELFFNIAMYRLYNWIETQEEIGFVEEYDATKYVEMMYERRRRGEKIFTGAHMLPGVGGTDKIQLVFGKCFSALWENRRELEPKTGDTLEEAFKRLCHKSPGYGPFIAYEVISDLRWTRYLDRASDIMSWANPGPGAQRGLVRLLGISPRQAGYKSLVGDMKYEDYIRAMRSLRNASDYMTADYVPIMEMRDIEHSLCEFDKYERVRNNEGRPRSKYHPPVGTAEQLELF